LKIFSHILKDSDDKMKLEIKIFTGKTTEKYLTKIKSRSGHIFKKMIKDAETAMKNSR